MIFQIISLSLALVTYLFRTYFFNLLEGRGKECKYIDLGCQGPVPLLFLLELGLNGASNNSLK